MSDVVFKNGSTKIVKTLTYEYKGTLHTTSLTYDDNDISLMIKSNISTDDVISYEGMKSQVIRNLKIAEDPEYLKKHPEEAFPWEQ